MAETETMSANVKAMLDDIVRKHPLEFDEWAEEHLREASQPAITCARPIVYVSTSERPNPDVGAYNPDGTPFDGDVFRGNAFPVRVIQIDWNEVAETDEDPAENSECSYVRELIADETLPQSLRDDIKLDYDHARRFDD